MFDSVPSGLSFVLLELSLGPLLLQVCLSSLFLVGVLSGRNCGSSCGFLFPRAELFLFLQCGNFDFFNISGGVLVTVVDASIAVAYLWWGSVE